MVNYLTLNIDIVTIIYFNNHSVYCILVSVFSTLIHFPRNQCNLGKQF